MGCRRSLPPGPATRSSGPRFARALAAIKLHTLLGLRGAIPAFIHISDSKLHDVNVRYILPVEAGAFYVMDRAYADFTRLCAMHQAGAFYATCGPRRTWMPDAWTRLPPTARAA